MYGGKFGKEGKNSSFFPGNPTGLSSKSDNRFHVPFRDIPDDMTGSRVPQGEVTTNRPFLRDLVSRRKASSANVESHLRIEAVTDDTQLQINEGDILIMPVRQRNFRGGIARYADREVQGAVMSSMRGMRVGEIDAKNPDQWRSNFAFAGFAKTNKLIGGITEGSRVAASMGGARSVRTNSHHVFLPGNMVRMELPSPIFAERRALAKAAQEVGVMIDVAKPYLRPEQPDDLRLEVAQHFESYLRNFVLSDNTRVERDELLLRDPFNPHDTNTDLPHILQFFVTEFGRGSAVDFCNNLALAEQLGLATLNIPTDTAALNRLSRSLQRVNIKTLDTNTNKAFRGVSPQGEMEETTTAAESRPLRNQRVAKVKALYELCGLVARENFDPSPDLVEMTMLKRLHGLVPPGAEFDHIRQQTAVTQTGPHAHKDTLDELEARIQNVHANRSRIGLLSFYQYFYEMTNKRIGVCLTATNGKNGVKGNQEVDIDF